MDRNRAAKYHRILLPVALRKESVDRNNTPQKVKATLGGSLSARRAWIEIIYLTLMTSSGVVALRKESVDRNSFYPQQWHLAQVALRKESVDRNRAAKYHRILLRWSLSARRAWIEIKAKKDRRK